MTKDTVFYIEDFYAFLERFLWKNFNSHFYECSQHFLDQTYTAGNLEKLQGHLINVSNVETFFLKLWSDSLYLHYFYDRRAFCKIFTGLITFSPPTTFKKSSIVVDLHIKRALFQQSKCIQFIGEIPTTFTWICWTDLYRILLYLFSRNAIMLFKAELASFILMKFFSYKVSEIKRQFLL